MKSLIAAAIAAALLAAPAWAQNAAKQSLSPADKAFVKTATEQNVAEMQMGQLSAERAHAPAVKMFARSMASSHGFAMRELAMLAGRHGDSPDMSLSQAAQDAIAQLKGLNGAEFDMAFVKAQVAILEQGLATARDGAEKAADPLLQTYATNTIPLFEANLEQAQALRQQIGK